MGNVLVAQAGATASARAAPHWHWLDFILVTAVLVAVSYFLV